MADLVPEFGAHVRNAQHSIRHGGRYAMVVRFPETPGIWSGHEFVLGPMCAGCIEGVAAVVGRWSEAYPLIEAAAVPWSSVAVLREGRWVPKAAE